MSKILTIVPPKPRDDKDKSIQVILKDFFFSFPPDQIEEIVKDFFEMSLSSEYMDECGDRRLTYYQFQEMLPKLMKTLHALSA